jgi:hypothetical protein
MPLNPEIMRTLLSICLLAMAVLAAFYLRRRDLSFPEYLRLGLLIVLVPLLGPFFVILSKPGKWRK